MRYGYLAKSGEIRSWTIFPRAAPNVFRTSLKITIELEFITVLMLLLSVASLNKLSNWLCMLFKNKYDLLEVNL